MADGEARRRATRGTATQVVLVLLVLLVVLMATSGCSVLAVPRGTPGQQAYAAALNAAVRHDVLLTLPLPGGRPGAIRTTAGSARGPTWATD